MEDKKNTNDLENCLCCLGSGVVYSHEEDSEQQCNICNGSGKAEKVDNECFLESINYN